MPAVKKEKHVSEKSKTDICNQNKVKEAIIALKLLEEKFVEKDLKKQPLLENRTESLIFLQIALKKIPPPQLLKMIRVPLPHSLVAETSEVCLITGDLEKRNHKAEIEPTVLHYKDLLKKHGVTNVAQVIPLRQLRTEYKTFESKRQLAAAYDVFLVDKKIAGVVPKTLGKSFFQGRKFPIQVDMRRLNLKEQINKALSQTKFSLACRGNSYALEIAKLSMENDAILENIMASFEVLADKLPGKENNILSLYLKAAKSKAIPIYVSLDISDDILIKKPRKKERVQFDELSTIDNAEVKVFRDGRIFLKKLKKNSSNEDAAEDDTNTNFNEPGDVLMENEENTQEFSANEVSLKKKKKKGKKSCDLINISDKAELENQEYTQASVTDETSPKKKKKSKKSCGLVEITDKAELENQEYTQDSVTDETSPKKKKAKEDINVKTPKSKKEKKAKDVIDSAKKKTALTFIEDKETMRNEKTPSRSKKEKKESTEVFSTQITSSMSKSTEDINVKTPKSKKEKKAKNVMDSAKKEITLTFIEDKETMKNEKTPSRSKREKKESTEDFSTQITSSVSKRKKANDIKNDLESNKQQKRHKRTCKT